MEEVEVVGPDRVTFREPGIELEEVDDGGGMERVAFRQRGALERIEGSVDSNGSSNEKLSSGEDRFEGSEDSPSSSSSSSSSVR